ncbi:MAG: ergothioneine biosynthesis protein EgtB [Acidimicrobiales bacterium]
MSADRYCEVRDWTEALAAPLSAEDQTVQSMPDVSPTKWHRAHTTWFFETFVLGPHAKGYDLYDPRFAHLFNSYYESVGPRHPRPERGLISRPGAAEIGIYRRHVDDRMSELLACGPPPDVAGLIELGIHHEQQHQELLLMDIKHVLSLNPLRPAYGSDHNPAGARAPAPGWLTHPGGVVEVGSDGTGFCFDNETPRHEVLLRPFQLAAGLVTCGDWIAFIADGGYHRPELWMSDGWALATTQGWESPLYWERAGGDWAMFTLAGPRPVDVATPVVHVSWFEADAFARWAGARLPLEAEWEAVAPAPSGTEARGLHPGTATADDPGQWYGHVWQWSASPYTAYPGFRAAAGAVGEYNGKFMVNQQTLRGSCCATPPGHARRSYRNFFPPAARWAFAGLRLARDDSA